jgi:tRNA (cytidine/uridine-2'-O-)-methyltransferase
VSLNDTIEVVLVEPQIPQNTGSIARTCAANRIPLHVVGPTPFEISEKKVRRAGLDYWPWVNLTIHESWDRFTRKETAKVWCLSTHGTRVYWDATFSSGDLLVFGSESKGLGAEFLSQYPPDQILTIPMSQPEVRSLNLSNAVSIVLYEALRQLSVGSPDYLHACT